jgi:putative aldouronate transport system substrate-binding protein
MEFPMYELSRRGLLAAAAGATALTLVGCDSSDSDDAKGNKTGAMDKFGVGDQFKATEPVTRPTGRC